MSVQMNTQMQVLTETTSSPLSLKPASTGFLQHKCTCGNNTVTGGECAECGKNKSGLQRKLAIGASNDPLEQEADRVADQVLKAPADPAIYGAIEWAGGCGAASVERVLSSSGRSLEPALRQDMEQRFGHDFSRVRVHSGSAAEQSAHEVSARAYTVGNNVVFNVGQYVPETHSGRFLVAHELTHVIQQGGYKHLIQRKPSPAAEGASQAGGSKKRGQATFPESRGNASDWKRESSFGWGAKGLEGLDW